MRVWFYALILAALLSPVLAFAEASYFGRLTTVLETYETVEGDRAVPVYQYLDFTLEDPVKLGAGGNYFYVYGRFAEDVAGNDPLKSRLYSAFFNVKGIVPRTDLRLGRQFISTTAGSAVTDGLELKARPFGDRINFRAFAGGDVKFDEKYEDGDYLFGGTLDIVPVPSATLGASYMQKYDEWDLSRQAIGMDAAYRFGTLARLYGEARYDVLSETLDTYLLGGKLFAGDRFTTALEYYYNVPVFDATDIYSVFAVNEYREAVVKADYKLSKYVNVFGSYAREFYEEGEDADVVELGGDLRRYKDFSVYAAALYRAGEDELLGAKLNGRYFVSEDFDVGAGIEGDSYERSDMTASETASRYFLDAKYHITPAASVYAKVEGIDSQRSDNELLARVRFSYAFRGGK